MRERVLIAMTVGSIGLALASAAVAGYSVHLVSTKQGPVGPAGEQGPQGIAGPAGPAGADGFDGADGEDRQDPLGRNPCQLQQVVTDVTIDRYSEFSPLSVRKAYIRSC